jgi:hypothetical protein
MKTNKNAWSFDENNLFDQLGLSSEEKEFLKPSVDEFIEAIIDSYKDFEIEIIEQEADSHLTNKGLLISGKRYHINLSTSTKDILLNALGIIANAFLLNSLKLLDLAAIITVGGVIILLNRIVKLDEQERKIVNAILHLKKSSKSRSYWPNTQEIAERLKSSPDVIDVTLLMLTQKNILQFESKKKEWRICF